MNLFSLLGADGGPINSWQDLAQVSQLSWVDDLFNWLGPVLWAIMAVVGAAGVVYSIFLGVNLARAEDQSKRDEAKKRLITTIIAVAVVIVLVIFFNTLLPMIIGAFIKSDGSSNVETGGGGAGGNVIQLAISLIK